MPQQLALLIRSGNPLISIETIDEERAARVVVEAARALSRPVCEWTMTTGLRRIDPPGLQGGTSPGSAIDALEQLRSGGQQQTVFLFKDLGPHCKDAQVHRTLRDLLATFAITRNCMVLLDALPLPEEIRRFTLRHEIGWPSTEELEDVVRRTYQFLRKDSAEPISSRVSRRDMEQIVQTLRGLTCGQAERVVASAILDDFALTAEDIPHIVEAKRKLLGTQGCLEAIAVDFLPDDIGGLENLKAWLAQRRQGFTKEAREFGLEPPRGLLMLGVPGCGKSLCAKVVAADWRMPLLRLDPGVLYQKFIGESESQLRQALAQAEAMAPCVLWIDEIEKAFASASAASADGGLSKRMFGTLLSWMQDHRHPIFIIATANDIAALPPELMRKGRFDAVFHRPPSAGRQGRNPRHPSPPPAARSGGLQARRPRDRGRRVQRVGTGAGGRLRSVQCVQSRERAAGCASPGGDPQDPSAVGAQRRKGCIAASMGDAPLRSG